MEHCLLKIDIDIWTKDFRVIHTLPTLETYYLPTKQNSSSQWDEMPLHLNIKIYVFWYFPSYFSVYDCSSTVQATKDDCDWCGPLKGFKEASCKSMYHIYILKRLTIFTFDFQRKPLVTNRNHMWICIQARLGVKLNYIQNVLTGAM